MKKMPNVVAAIMPPATPVPTAMRLDAPAPRAISSGTMPSTNASDVMMIGRNRSFTAASVASIVLLPCASSSIANSTMRIAFFAARPMMVTSPTLKYTSAPSPRIIVNRIEPSTPSGTTRSTDTGTAQLSYNAASSRNTTISDTAISDTIWPDDWASSNERPVQSNPKPAGSWLASRSISAIASPVERPGGPVHRGERAERHHLAQIVAHLEIEDVLRRHAVGRVGREQHAEDAASAAEVVGVRAAERDRQRGVDVRDGEPERPRFDPVDHHAKLRRVLLPLGPHADEHGALAGRAEQLVARRAQLLERVAAAILEHEAEAARHAEPLDRRRVEREHHRFLDLHQRPERPVHQRHRGVLVSWPLVPRLEPHERDRVRL